MRKLGESHTIKVTGGGNGTYSWISEDDGIASVDENGKVVAVSNGTVNVVVTDGNKKGVCIVRVRASGTSSQAPSGGGEASAHEIEYGGVLSCKERREARLYRGRRRRNAW